MLEKANRTPAPKRAPTGKSGPKRGGRAKTVIERPQNQGWATTDDQEIDLRRWRGRTEIAVVEALEPEHPIFGAFRAQSEGGGAYEVEIRALDQLTNTCDCIDHQINGLGVCKHIEGVLAGLRRRGARAFAQAAARGSERVELFLRRHGETRPELVWPQAAGAATDAVAEWLSPYLDDARRVADDAEVVARLIEAYQTAPALIRAHLRVSRHFRPWLERQARQRLRDVDRAAFLAEAENDPGLFEVLRHPLLPYQRAGMIHLAFGERALLADEMGLGKTIQAIAACELLARRKEIRRVLVVCPASLKAEWEEQIARFSDRPAQSVFGPRPARLAAYREPPFFTIVNYEQVLGDAEAINAVLAPDIVVLDEAQRIKNWRTKTARKVKALRSPYAFVLTGTPVENRIDELYSIVQYLDPELVGPLFRFNRSFYALDDRGRPIDYRNLEELRRRVAPVILRRRKADVETELPGRTLKTYFTPMTEEQQLRYDEYAYRAAKIANLAERRPLTKEEFDRLQMLMACMRMICDTPAILDPNCRDSPKLEELERILEDLLQDPDRKIIIFSEWERMLSMIRELASEFGVEAAWHTGSTPQLRRREEINRFKQDPACRLFLSTDSGAVGLNLQVASVVINVDLPWNPAKLEQRIARAWRKHQTKSVQVINLVAEKTIEHSIQFLLGAKQALSDGLLDGQGDIEVLKMPSGRGALVERMKAMLDGVPTLGPRILSPEESLMLELRDRHAERFFRLEVRRGTTGDGRALVVLDLEPQALAAEAERIAARPGGPAAEVIDLAAWLALKRLMSAGMLGLTGGDARVLHSAEALDEAQPLPDTTAWREEADRAVRMASVLAAGGFPEEAPSLVAKALRLIVAAHAKAAGDSAADPGLADPEQLLGLKASVASADLAHVLDGLDPTGDKGALDSAKFVEAAARLVAALWPGADTPLRRAA
jgi:superfamily II DNA or RNA helicase